MWEWFKYLFEHPSKERWRQIEQDEKERRERERQQEKERLEKALSERIPLHKRLHRIRKLCLNVLADSNKFYPKWDRDNTLYYYFNTTLGWKRFYLYEDWDNSVLDDCLRKITFRYYDIKENDYPMLFSIGCKYNSADVYPIIERGVTSDSIDLALLEIEEYLIERMKETEEIQAWHDSQVKILEQKEGLICQD